VDDNNEHIYMKRLEIIALLILLSAFLAGACQQDPIPDPKPEEDPEMKTDVIPYLPRQELIGAWMATVYGIDWPKEKYAEESQKRLYTDYLDYFKSLNINAVFFQVRPQADAYYDSEFEPWSRFITGTEGKVPSYDVLSFLIEEAHKRGIQFHAWINPYRIDVRSGSDSDFRELDSRIPKSLVKDYQKIRIYNPALPETRERLAAIVTDLINRYPVDGVHMDDYFYPSLEKGEAMNDNAEFEKYGTGFHSIEDWRRNNITEMVKLVRAAINNTRPEVTFSISPQGNYDNNYNSMYFDTKTVCMLGLIDLIIPQLYWSTTASTDYFTPRLDWFSTNISDVKMMVGYAAYRFDGKTAGFTSSSELLKELKLSAMKSNVVGGVFYNSSSVFANPLGISDVIKGYYSNAILPPCVKNGASVPDVPSNVKLSGTELTWNPVDGASGYVVYRSKGDRKTAESISLVKGTEYRLERDGVYFITAYSDLYAQSSYSELILFKAN